MGEVLDKERLLEVLAQRRSAPEAPKVITTNGCFDLLHVGHLRYLQACRQAADILVVLLNTDASVRRLKGPKRPIVNESDRAELLAGLACVDYVTLFDEDTPETLLALIRPDFHAKGAQYNEDNLPEMETLRHIGARPLFMPMADNRSTSALIEIIQGQASGCGT